MPIVTNFDAATAIRSHVVTGPVTVDELVAELAQVYQSEDLPTRSNVIWDFTGADVSGITSAEVAQLAQFVKAAWKEHGDFRIGFAVKPGVTHGLTRMYEQLLDLFDEDHIRIFRTYDEAQAWITS